VGLNASDIGEVVNALGRTLVDSGSVLDGYLEDVLRREQEFPTGLPTPIPVAIPHASSDNCVSTALAIGILDKPVTFREMGTPDRQLDVEMVFLLAIKNVQEQTLWLKNLMKIFKDKEFMLKLKNCMDSMMILQLMADALKG